MILRDIGAADWALWRSLRLAALAEAPYAFGSTLAEWRGADETRWRARLTTVPLNTVIFVDDVWAGMVSATREVEWIAPTCVAAASAMRRSSTWSHGRARER